ncbi:MAG: FdhF/YdeP family oxidoreductase, partial [Sinobacteraceae bacterium]|nr:FdhF/YdeP family oxidoreductase [Nevskiaceae bacterium]
PERAVGKPQRMDQESNTHGEPVGGWGSLKSVTSVLVREHVALAGTRLLAHQNKPNGFMCVSCAWAKPAQPHPAEFCENGAKATAWEITTERTTPEFFAAHTLTQLEGWSDHDLEKHGRLTEPLRWDADSDRYVPVMWQEAFTGIARELCTLEPRDVVFYASGRASLESSYLYQLLARAYGNNNLPDSSNMCHESTSVALPKSIGVGVGTVTLDDFEQTDCILFFGQNVGSNSPRMLHQLQDARKRNVPIVTFNPIRETGLVSFANPQSPLEMLTGASTQISTQYHQVRIGGDVAALMGLCKSLFQRDDEAQQTGAPRVLDVQFIAEHTHGFEEFAASVRTCTWDDIEHCSGLERAALEEAAEVYLRASAVIAVYGMGLTQHRNGVETVQMLTNLLLLRGNIGKPGAGICPVRGHSNVQGQRTVGITEKPELAPLDKLKELYGFEPPRDKGLSTVEACEGVLSGRVKAFVSLGGNFVRAAPDTDRLEPAWRKLRLTVNIATKLNRSHLIHGQVAYLLPCLGRLEIDRQDGVEQVVSMEDSTGCMHGSRGFAEPVGPSVRSEPAIIAGIAKALLPANPRIPWDQWVADYSLIRDAIARTWPEIFHDFNSRMFTPGGFHRPLPARHRQWKTKTGKANFIEPSALDADPDMRSPRGGILRLMTIRSNDQFNTTIYGFEDRFRGVHGTRKVLLMSAEDIEQQGLQPGDLVTVSTVADDHVREVANLRVTPYSIPAGCAAAYYPECNPLVPLWHHAVESKVPASKSIPVRIRRNQVRQIGMDDEHRPQPEAG